MKAFRLYCPNDAERQNEARASKRRLRQNALNTLKRFCETVLLGGKLSSKQEAAQQGYSWARDNGLWRAAVSGQPTAPLRTVSAVRLLTARRDRP